MRLLSSIPLLLINICPGPSWGFHRLHHHVHVRRQQVSRWMIDTDDETNSMIGVPFAEKALQSAGMAKKLRAIRSNRGRTQTDEKPTMAKQIASEKAPTTGSPRRRSGDSLPYQSALAALQAYYSIHGNLVIPRRFQVPAQDEYPPEWHGLDLSSTVYAMRWWVQHVRYYPDRVAELNTLGFVWDRLQPEWNLIMEALIGYLTLHGDLLVPTSFVVPYGDEEWPKSTWGIKLGKHVYRMRSRNDFLRGFKGATRRRQLDRLGFVWDINDHVFRKFCYALQYYSRWQRQKTNNSGRQFSIRIPSTFIVPSGGEGYPKELWGYPLGAKCAAVRHKGLYVKNNIRRQQILEELGFQWNGNAAMGWLEVVHAAAIYSQMHNRNLDVPYGFIVPAPANEMAFTEQRIAGSDNAWPWPEYLWGLPLGQRLKDVRVKGAYLHGPSGKARRDQLDALGFNWTPKQGRPGTKG
jgi:Helicase associated domain